MNVVGMKLFLWIKFNNHMKNALIWNNGHYYNEKNIWGCLTSMGVSKSRKQFFILKNILTWTYHGNSPILLNVYTMLTLGWNLPTTTE